MVDHVTHVGHDEVGEGDVADGGQRGADHDVHTVARHGVGKHRTDHGKDGAHPDGLGAAQLLDHGQHQRDAGPHRGQGDHLEGGLDGGPCAVLVAADNPAAVIDQGNVAHIAEDVEGKNRQDKDDPVFVSDADLELLRESSFGLDQSVFRFHAGGLVGQTDLTAAFLGDALTGEEVLDEGEGDRDAAHQAHGEQITLGVVAVHGGADAGEDHREENGDDAGAYIAGDLSGGGQVLALLDIAGGESGRQLLGHVPHGERHAVVEHIGEADPCGLSSGAGEGHPEQQHHAEHHQRNGHDQPGPDLTLPADRGVDDLGHDNVGHRVEQLREQREEDHKAGHPHRPLRREAEHVRHVLVVIAVDDGLYDQHPVGADHIAQPHFLRNALPSRPRFVFTAVLIALPP